MMTDLRNLAIQLERDEEFNNKMMNEHFNEIPENQRQLALERMAQVDALLLQYKRDKSERSLLNLLVVPLIISLFGFALGLIVNEVFFHINNPMINIGLCVIGTIIFIIFIIKVFSVEFVS